MSVAALERYMEWVSMHEHLDQALHNEHVEDLEKQWRHNYKDKSNDTLGYVPSFVLHDDIATMWNAVNLFAAGEDAETYLKRYRRSGQFVLSRTFIQRTARLVNECL